MSAHPESIDLALRRLSDVGLSRAERRALERVVEAFVQGPLRASLMGWTSATRFVDDALAYALERACRANNSYQGEHGERSAWTWLETIARRYVLSALRREVRAADREARDLEVRALEALAEREEREAFARARVVFEKVRALCLRPGQRSNWNEYVPLAFTARWPSLQTEGEHASRVDDDPVAQRRARNELAQRRRRGRRRLGELLVVLVAEGMDQEEAAAVAGDLRVPFPPPPRELRRAN